MRHGESPGNSKEAISSLWEISGMDHNMRLVIAVHFKVPRCQVLCVCPEPWRVPLGPPLFLAEALFPLLYMRAFHGVTLKFYRPGDQSLL